MATERRTPPESTNGALPAAAPFERPPVEPPALVLAAPVFWERYKALILGALALVVLGLVGSAVYGALNARKLAAASGALGAAKTPEDFAKVTNDYPDTPAGADAWLLLARAQREQGDAKAAEATLRTFSNKYPQNPLAGGALLALAGEVQARGDRDGALGLFQQAADRYSKSYSAPLALLGKAELLRVMGKTDDAKRAYENLIATFPGSIAAQQAQGALRFLRAPVSAGAPAVAPVASSSPAPTPAGPGETAPAQAAIPATSPAPGGTP